MDKVSSQMYDVQHQELFIVALLPHIHVPLMQQNIVSNTEVLDLAMKLGVSQVGETSVGIVLIQSRLDSLSLQIQDIKDGKEIHEEI